MKFEKRSSGAPEPGAEETPSVSHVPGGKPVVVYILILFLAAFLLMALSLLMHQRDNTEALGQLQTSVSAMQDVQALQERVIQLQDELNEARQENESLRTRAETLEKDLAEAHQSLDVLPDVISHQEYQLEHVTEAMDCFWQLTEAYGAENYQDCRTLMDRLEAPLDGGVCLRDFLPEKSAAGTGAPSPMERYAAIREALP